MSRGLYLGVVVVVLACVSSVQAVDIVTVTVGNPGNAGELSGEGAGGIGPDRICGAVDYVYEIGKFEITAGQYTEFLNAVADDDTYGLYNTGMWSYDWGCKIERTGSSPDFSYSVAPDWADRPVNYVSWGDAARFANWLHNRQPTSAQDLTTTEDGSYFLDGATTNEQLVEVVREEDATYVIPSEDEWYKAAYHYNDGVTANYYDYPTSSDSVPVSEACPGGSNSANYYAGKYAVGPPFYRNEVGCYVSSDSPYDTFDQGGNVWEWNEAILYGSYRGLRGSCFYGNDNNMRAATRVCTTPTNENYSIGFRVADLRGQCDDDAECEGNYCWAHCDPDHPDAGPDGCVHEYRERKYADVYPVPDGDGAVEGFDILCVLDAANDLDTYGCMTVMPSGYMAGDIYPCEVQDGAVEGFDILAVLDAANDMKWCDDPCPPVR